MAKINKRRCRGRKCARHNAVSVRRQRRIECDRNCRNVLAKQYKMLRSTLNFEKKKQRTSHVRMLIASETFIKKKEKQLEKAMKCKSNLEHNYWRKEFSNVLCSYRRNKGPFFYDVHEDNFSEVSSEASASPQSPPHQLNFDSSVKDYQTSNYIKPGVNCGVKSRTIGVITLHDNEIINGLPVPVVQEAQSVELINHPNLLNDTPKVLHSQNMVIFESEDTSEKDKCSSMLPVNLEQEPKSEELKNSPTKYKTTTTYRYFPLTHLEKEPDSSSACSIQKPLCHALESSIKSKETISSTKNEKEILIDCISAVPKKHRRKRRKKKHNQENVIKRKCSDKEAARHSEPLKEISNFLLSPRKTVVSEVGAVNLRSSVSGETFDQVVVSDCLRGLNDDVWWGSLEAEPPSLQPNSVEMQPCTSLSSYLPEEELQFLDLSVVEPCYFYNNC